MRRRAGQQRAALQVRAVAQHTGRRHGRRPQVGTGTPGEIDAAQRTVAVEQLRAHADRAGRGVEKVLGGLLAPDDAALARGGHRVSPCWIW
ncbi:hypothetical protein DY023_02735 [Microbacterium bovistercoris]|uniref:Uncharacterized protein n=1 Tax=Microbacterium bovistercoris TaxID=2293570 RepID=A0A371NXI4_9MICO|nr:hypothetical protein DY023_02735 [Microbacterium bovistercoris]